MSSTPPYSPTGGDPGHGAPVDDSDDSAVGGLVGRRSGPTPARPAWIAMGTAVAVEFAVGVAALVLVPVGRPSRLFPHRGLFVFDLHAAVGILLLGGAVALVVAANRFTRVLRIASWVALVGIVVAGAGGLAAADHGLRVLGIGLMFVGSLAAGFAYLVGVVEPPPASSDDETGVQPT